MRNLRLIEITRVSVPNGKCFAIDSMRHHVYVAGERDIYCVDPGTKQVVSTLNLSPADNILSIEYLIDQEILCIATTNGELYTWNVGLDELESVGYVSSGITCMGWSPDFEVLVITTGEGKFILMTCEFDPITESEIHASDFGEATQVNVGWGKKETQFHGSAGKPSPEDLKPPEVNPVLQWDDQKTRISWHGDASYFTINSVDQRTGIRKIRVWSKEGVLFSTSEAVDGLEQSLCWRPSGQLIASTQRKQHKHEIVFFEKNGLRHGEFALPFGTKEVKVMELAWNNTSEMLALWIEEIKDPIEDDSSCTSAEQSLIQIWTCNNYHWYLKQELRLGGAQDGRVSAFRWDPEKNETLHVLCGEKYYNFGWVSDVFYSTGLSEKNLSTVAVIDGKELLLTPFKLTITPPPMAAQTLQAHAPILQLSFGPGEISSSVAMMLSDGTLIVAIAKPGKTTRSLPEYELINFGSVFPKPFEVYHLLWLSASCLIFVMPSENGESSSIGQINLSYENSSEPTARAVSRVAINDTVTAVCRKVNSCSALLQGQGGCLYQYNPDCGEIVQHKSGDGVQLKMPQTCFRMESVEVEDRLLVFGLSQNYRLYMNDIEICNNCTSFAVHEEFLVLTTLEHKCRCILLQSLKKGGESVFKKEELEEGVRATERGSKIVVPVINDSKVVLQMPRGNLEAIHPRALVVSTLKKMLNRLQYREALSTMKRHRINLNLICDHDMKLFLDNIDRFIADVGDPSDLNLFLADLRKEDVTTTLYKPYYNRRSELVLESSGSKNTQKDVDLICKTGRIALERTDPEKYTLSILTTYVMQKDKDLESALLIIKQMRDREWSGSQNVVVPWEKALKYVLYLVDVNELYDVALGLYDFDLVLLVAEKSQKDPKEYLPFLNKLKQMEPNYRKYSIDVGLRRYEKALVHIQKAGTDHFDECLKLVNDHQLHRHALAMYTRGSMEHKEISRAYGKHLMDSKKYVEAGIVFSGCQEYKEAMEAFSKALHWSMALSAAFELKLSAVEVSSLARKMSESLKGKKRYKEAAYLLEIYSQDHEEAIIALIEGHHWAEAFSLIQRFDRHDISDTNLKPSLLEEFKNAVALLSEKRSQFAKFHHRLDQVRDEKQKRGRMAFANENFQDDPDNDLFSDVSSITGQSTMSTSSKTSRSSGHSSKSRRKTQRKKYSLKEGSQYEDFALMEALAEIVNTCDRLQEEIGATIQMLSYFQYEAEAESLQSHFTDLWELISNQMDPIWKPKTSLGPHIALGPDISANSLVASLPSVPDMTSFNLSPDLPEPTRATLRKDIPWKLSLASSLRP